MGPWAGYVTRLVGNMEYVLTPATIVVGIGGYLGCDFGTAKSMEPLWWDRQLRQVRRAECVWS